MPQTRTAAHTCEARRFSTGGRRGRADTGRATRLRLGHRSRGRSSIPTTVSVTGLPLTPPTRDDENVSAPSLKQRRTDFSITPDCVCGETDKRRQFLPDASPRETDFCGMRSSGHGPASRPRCHLDSVYIESSGPLRPLLPGHQIHNPTLN